MRLYTGKINPGSITPPTNITSWEDRVEPTILHGDQWPDDIVEALSGAQPLEPNKLPPPVGYHWTEVGARLVVNPDGSTKSELYGRESG